MGTQSNQGSAYVFVRSGSTWTQQQQLRAGDGALGDLFGSSVSASANTVVVGAYADDVGPNGQGTTCEEQCEACDVLGSDGVCTAITGAPHGGRPACGGSDPQCTGDCDGQKRDGCALPDLTQTCGMSLCQDGLERGQVCDGRGACVNGTPRQCGSLGCNRERTHCAKCVTDDDCGPGQACDDDGLCVDQGAPCDGIWLVSPSGARRSCGDYRCIDPPGECLTQCGKDGDCAEGHACDATECIPGAQEDESGGGCGCTVISRARNAGALALLGPLLLLACRRRHRRHR